MDIYRKRMPNDTKFGVCSVKLGIDLQLAVKVSVCSNRLRVVPNLNSLCGSKQVT